MIIKLIIKAIKKLIGVKVKKQIKESAKRHKGILLNSV